VTEAEGITLGSILTFRPGLRPMPSKIKPCGPRDLAQEIPNDFVWIFAGGTPPNDFLKKIAVGFGARDLTLKGAREASPEGGDECGSSRS
jgi:hypothetical protein